MMRRKPRNQGPTPIGLHKRKEPPKGPTRRESIKFYLQTVTATLVAIMAVLVSVSQCSISREQVKLSKEQIKVAKYQARISHQSIKPLFKVLLKSLKHTKYNKQGFSNPGIFVKNVGGDVVEHNIAICSFLDLRIFVTPNKIKHIAIPIIDYYGEIIETELTSGLMYMIMNRQSLEEHLWYLIEKISETNIDKMSLIDVYVKVFAQINYYDSLGNVGGEYYKLMSGFADCEKINDDVGKYIFKKYNQNIKKYDVQQMEKMGVNQLIALINLIDSETDMTGESITFGPYD